MFLQQQRSCPMMQPAFFCSASGAVQGLSWVRLCQAKGTHASVARMTCAFHMPCVLPFFSSSLSLSFILSELVWSEGPKRLVESLPQPSGLDKDFLIAHMGLHCKPQPSDKYTLLTYPSAPAPALAPAKKGAGMEKNTFEQTTRQAT